MDYREVIASKARSNETIRAFAYRMSKSNKVVTASYVKAFWPFSKEDKQSPQPQQSQPKPPAGKTFIIFTFDKKADIMHVSKNGQEIVSFRGEDAWGKAISFFKRKFMQGELDPKTTHFLYTGKKGMIDISSDFALSGKY